MQQQQKKRKAAQSKVKKDHVYTLDAAAALVKEVNTAKFDASVDLHIRLGVDPRKADQAIRGTVAGATHIDPNVAGKLLKQVAHPEVNAGVKSSVGADLSERELEILRLVADGLSNAEIAERLHLSKGTVQNYMSTIFAKLDVTDRTQAAILALRHGLVG